MQLWATSISAALKAGIWIEEQLAEQKSESSSGRKRVIDREHRYVYLGFKHTWG